MKRDGKVLRVQQSNEGPRMLGKGEVFVALARGDATHTDNPREIRTHKEGNPVGPIANGTGSAPHRLAKKRAALLSKA